MKALFKWKVLLLLVSTMVLCGSCATLFPRWHHPRPPRHSPPPPPPPGHKPPHRPSHKPPKPPHKPPRKHRPGPYRPMAFLTAQEMQLEEVFVA